jgi:hypothetical protein
MIVASPDRLAALAGNVKAESSASKEHDTPRWLAGLHCIVSSGYYPSNLAS